MNPFYLEKSDASILERFDDTMTDVQHRRLTALFSAMAAAKVTNSTLYDGVDPVFLFGAASDTDVNGDLMASSFGFGFVTDTDVNGDIIAGVGPAGNFLGVIR